MGRITEEALRRLSQEGSISIDCVRDLMRLAYDEGSDGVDMQEAQELLGFWAEARRHFDSDAERLMQEFYEAYRTDMGLSPGSTEAFSSSGGGFSTRNSQTVQAGPDGGGATQRTCSTCGGGGMVTCSSCGGMGYHSVTGSRVLYDGSVEYYEDRHSCACSCGQSACYACGGSGMIYS